MNAELKAKWIAALRSGKYQQCREVLADGHGYCCLGVLHRELTGSEPPQFWNDSAGIDKPDDIKTLSFSQVKTLATMNDDGKSFAEIADYIEANL